MRLSLLGLLLAIVAPAHSAATFPLRFEGQSCDLVNDVCLDIVLVLERSRTLREEVSGLVGTWSFDKDTATFTGSLPAAGMTLVGAPVPQSRCLSGDWSSTPGNNGPFLVCRTYAP